MRYAIVIALQTPRSVKEGEWRCSRNWNRDSPVAHAENHGEAAHGGADIHLQPVEDPTPGQGDA